MAAPAHSPPLRFYFSLRSPYSWLALRELAASRPRLAERLEWRPFWEPDEAMQRALTERGGRFPYTPMSRAKQFYILRDVRRLTAQRGLSVTWPVDRAPRWEVPHLAWFLARRAGLGPAWVTRLSEARWLEGRDICDPRTVGELAGGLGMDPEKAAGAADDPELREEAVGALLNVHRDGVFGVPYFVAGTEPYWGLDRLAGFVAATDEPVREGRGSPPASARTAVGSRTDLGHAGGCG